MTTTPAARDERNPVIHQAFIFSDNPWLQAILPQGAIICGPEPVEVVLASDYAIAESELAEVREQLRQMTKDRDDCVEARLHYAGKMCEALGERDELRAELERVKASHPSQWSDGQVLDFLGVALRNVDLTGEVKLSEIRQGFDHVARLVAIDAARGVEG